MGRNVGARTIALSRANPLQLLNWSELREKTLIMLVTFDTFGFLRRALGSLEYLVEKRNVGSLDVVSLGAHSKEAQNKKEYEGYMYAYSMVAI
eukprot:IDg15728t1